MRRAFGLPLFRRLLAAYSLNELAWGAGTLALTVLVYRRTGSALGAMSFFLCSQFAPALLTPLVVARIDRSSPRLVLPALYGLEALLFGMLAWMAGSFEVAVVLVLVVADGVLATAARALANTARVDVLKPVGLLREGNALANSVFWLCYFVGPLFGGVIVALGGTRAALIINGALFAVMAAVLATAELPRRGTPSGSNSGRVRAALAYALADRQLSSLLALYALGLAAFTISIPVEIVFVSHSLHDGPAAYGTLLSIWGGGAVVGSVMYARWRHGRPAIMISSSALAIGIGVGLMAASSSLVVALIGALIAGAGNGVVVIVMQTAIQESASQKWMALIMSLNETIASLAPGLGILIGGVVTALTSPRVGLAVASGAALIFAAVALAVMRSDRATSPGSAPDSSSDYSDATAGATLARPEPLV